MLIQKLASIHQNMVGQNMAVRQSFCVTGAGAMGVYGVLTINQCEKQP
jgi:hypothetical protein